MTTEVNVKKLAPGAPLSFVNAPSDVKTILADGFGSMTFDASIIKLGFYEKIADLNGDIMARYVVNLALNRDGLVQLRDVLSQAITQVDEVIGVRE